MRGQAGIQTSANGLLFGARTAGSRGFPTEQELRLEENMVFAHKPLGKMDYDEATKAYARINQVSEMAAHHQMGFQIKSMKRRDAIEYMKANEKVLGFFDPEDLDSDSIDDLVENEITSEVYVANPGITKGIFVMKAFRAATGFDLKRVKNFIDNNRSNDFVFYTTEHKAEQFKETMEEMEGFEVSFEPVAFAKKSRNVRLYSKTFVECDQFPLQREYTAKTLAAIFQISDQEARDWIGEGHKATRSFTIKDPYRCEAALSKLGVNIEFVD